MSSLAHNGLRAEFWTGGREPPNIGRKNTHEEGFQPCFSKLIDHAGELKFYENNLEFKVLAEIKIKAKGGGGRRGAGAEEVPPPHERSPPKVWRKMRKLMRANFE